MYRPDAVSSEGRHVRHRRTDPALGFCGPGPIQPGVGLSVNDDPCRQVQPEDRGLLGVGVRQRSLDVASQISDCLPECFAVF